MTMKILKLLIATITLFSVIAIIPRHLYPYLKHCYTNNVADMKRYTGSHPLMKKCFNVIHKYSFIARKVVYYSHKINKKRYTFPQYKGYSPIS